MQNPQATSIRKGVRALGQGLLEEAIFREGYKGCSPILCTQPVSLEPAYIAFNGTSILQSQKKTEDKDREVQLGKKDLSNAPPALPEDIRTWQVFVSSEDILSIGWMDSLLQALTSIGTALAFELAGSGGKVRFRFGVPARRSDVFRAALLGLFPAARVIPDEKPFPEGEPAAVEELVPVPPYHRSGSLLGKDGASPLGIVVGSIAGLAPENFGLFQVLLQPADPDHDWHYNVENLVEAERQAKELEHLGGLSSGFRYDRRVPPLMEPSATEKVRRDVAFYAVIVRYAVWAEAEDQQQLLLGGMRSATSMVRFGNRCFRRISNETLVASLGKKPVARMVVERLAHRPGLMVTSEEAATFVHLPNARTLEMFQEIEQRRGLEWTGPDVTPAGALVLGINPYAGVNREVRLPQSQRLQHTYLSGVTGMGKSEAMKTIALNDAKEGRGFVALDPHGDFCLDLLSRLPEDRMVDLEYVSFGEPGRVPRWNPFGAAVPSGKLADDITRSFAATTTSTFGPRMEHNFRLLAFVVHRLRGTLEDLAELVGKTARGEELRVRGIAEIQDPVVQRFLREELPKYRAAELDSVRNKLSRLLLDESIGAMFRQPENDLEPREWMDRGKVVLVNLSSGRIGADHARFAGSLLVSLIHRAAISRADTPNEERRPFFLYIDEFQLLQSGTLEEILSEGRKYGLGAILAHQEGGQLSAELLQSLGNCGTRVVFRPSLEDAPRLRRALLGRVTDADLLSLGRGEAFVAGGNRVGSLRTELCKYPVLRDGRATAAEYAKSHYWRIEETPTVPKPRMRRFDVFGKGDQ